jgi:probable phosphoglycerate mutase
MQSEIEMSDAVGASALTGATETAPARADETVPSGNGGAPKPEAEAGAAAKPEVKPTRILLIRHGINDYVKKGLLAGRTAEVHLNDEGNAQAEALAERLGTEKIAAIYASPLERCQETAAPLAARLSVELWTLDGVKETDCGDWTKQPLEELRKLDAWMQVQVQPAGFRFPNGESMLEIQARMVAALDELQRRHAGETIAVFSHSDPIKLAICYYVGVPLDLFQRLEVSPASISELVFSPLRVRLVRLNDCAHVPPSPKEPEAEHLEESAEGTAHGAAKGALEEQVIKGPRGAGPEPEAVQLADEGKMQATGG